MKIKYTETTVIAGNYVHTRTLLQEHCRALDIRRKEVRHRATTDNARLPLYCARYQQCSLSFFLSLARFTLPLPQALFSVYLSRAATLTDALLFIYAHLKRRAPNRTRNPQYSAGEGAAVLGSTALNTLQIYGFVIFVEG